MADSVYEEMPPEQLLLLMSLGNINARKQLQLQLRLEAWLANWLNEEKTHRSVTITKDAIVLTDHIYRDPKTWCSDVLEARTHYKRLALVLKRAGILPERAAM